MATQRGAVGHPQQKNRAPRKPGRTVSNRFRKGRPTNYKQTTKAAEPSIKDVLNFIDRQRFEERNITEADVRNAKGAWEQAFSAAGLIGPEGLVCPSCGKGRRKKVVFNPERASWYCYRCSSGGDTIGVVMDKLSLTFPEAVAMLVGKNLAPVVKEIPKSFKASDVITQTRQSNVDYHVYTAVLNSQHVSLQQAQTFYATWHISPEIVEEQQARVVTNPDGLLEELLTIFGEQRLIDAGIGIEAGTWPNGTPRPFRLLLNHNYPVIEPQIGPSGKVLNLQFRGSVETRRKVAAHKAGNGPYVPAFLSLAGQSEHHKIGCGLEPISKLTKPTTIYIVEGFKDLLAARTLGAQAYALPGAGMKPPLKVIDLFKTGGHKLLLSFDGDDAGQQGQQKLAAYLAENGYPNQPDGSPHKLIKIKNDMPSGFDVTDLLVKQHATAGCECKTCQTMLTATTTN